VAISLPQGFTSYVANVGVKDDSKDFTVVLADAGSTSAGVFTKSRFAGPSVEVSRRHNTGHARAMVVISKNANVANGPLGWLTLKKSRPPLPPSWALTLLKFSLHPLA
jgi:glutamate N-acetyltransferase / amino-acid N-acetyltransferase